MTNTSKKLTPADIVASAKDMGIEPAALQAVIVVECAGSGFNDDGSPVILFERHVLWRELGKVNYITKRQQLSDLFPDICHPAWDKSAYKVRPSHQKLYVASVLHWDAAHASCSWGIGQVMGNNWKALGYPSLKAFVDEMHESEAKQLDAMCRYIKVNNLITKLRNHDWAGFAKGYNGAGYKANAYDEKLAAAYARAKAKPTATPTPQSESVAESTPQSESEKAVPQDIYICGRYRIRFEPLSADTGEL